jgi:hypothetical protein
MLASIETDNVLAVFTDPVIILYSPETTHAKKSFADRKKFYPVIGKNCQLLPVSG